MPELHSLEEFLAGGRSMPPCSSCDRTTAPCCSPSTGSSRAPATQAAMRCCDAAEAAAAGARATAPVEELPHVAAWREAYRAFGAKPQRTRNSLEALLAAPRRGCRA